MMITVAMAGVGEVKSLWSIYTVKRGGMWGSSTSAVPDRNTSMCRVDSETYICETQVSKASQAIVESGLNDRRKWLGEKRKDQQRRSEKSISIIRNVFLCEVIS